MNVRISENGKVHVRRFSWHTACGMDFNIDDHSVSETREAVSCKKCLAERRYWHVGEVGVFGILIDRDERSIELVDQLRETWYRGREDAAERAPYTYTIKIFSPFQLLGHQMISMVAELPDDDAALNLAETIVWWRFRVMQGYLMDFSADEPNKEPEAITEPS